LEAYEHFFETNFQRKGLKKSPINSEYSSRILSPSVFQREFGSDFEIYLSLYEPRIKNLLLEKFKQIVQKIIFEADEAVSSFSLRN